MLGSPQYIGKVADAMQNCAAKYGFERPVLARIGDGQSHVLVLRRLYKTETPDSSDKGSLTDFMKKVLSKTF